MVRTWLPTATSARFLPRRLHDPSVAGAQGKVVVLAAPIAAPTDGGADPGVALAGGAGPGLASRGFSHGREVGPRHQVASAGEAAHLDADLGDQLLRADPAHAGDRIQLRPVGWPGGVAPPGSHRSRHEPLGSPGSCRLITKAAVIRSPHATCAYSWISPPSRSRRATLPTDTTADSPGPSGGACPKARCGRCTL